MSDEDDFKALEGRFPTLMPISQGGALGLLALALWDHSLFLGLLAPLWLIGGCAVITALDQRRGDGPPE